MTDVPAPTPLADSAADAGHHGSPQQQGIAALGLGALGIVFGDIGTSPLYTLKTVLGSVGAHALAR